MKQILVLCLPVILSGSCRNAEVEPGEVAATITNAVIADNWAKSCSSGGLQIRINNVTYVASNTLPAPYEDANAWPISVWIRYEAAESDQCVGQTNRIRVLSVRKRSG